MLINPLVSLIPLLLFVVEKSSQFRDLIDSPVFVDKTLLLYDFFDDITSGVRQFVSCPHGFGKTTIIEMIELFGGIEFNYDNTIKLPNATDAFEIFNRTRIKFYTKFVNSNLAQYVVLRLDLDNEREEKKTYTVGLAYDFVYDVLIKGLDKYSELLNEDKLSRSERMFLQELYERRFDTKEIPCLLGYLIKMLHGYFQRPVILLIDNYDLPIKRSIFAADSNPNVDILYDIFNEVLFYASKYPRNYLQRIMIMSTTTIPFNWYKNETKSFHLHEFAVKNAYEKFLGFTEAEMKELTAKWKLTQAERKELREFYMAPNIHPETDIYNPRSITNYLKYRDAIKTNRTLHRRVYETLLDDFKTIIAFFQETEFEQKLFLLSSNQSICLPGIWLGDKLTLSVLKNTTDYKDFVNRAYVWIYMLESSYVTYSMDGLGFQAASQEIMYVLRESLYDHFDRTRIPFDKIGSTMLEFVDIRVVSNNRSMSDSISRFEHYLSKAFKSIDCSPQVHPREAVFAAVIFISSHTSTELESSMGISAVEIRSNLTVSSARYSIYYQDSGGRRKTAVVMGLKCSNGTRQSLEQVQEFVPPRHRFVKYLTYMAVNVDSQMDVRVEFVTQDAGYVKRLSVKSKSLAGMKAAKNNSA